MTPHEMLAKHEDLITLVTEHAYIPHASQANFQQVVEALKKIQPTAVYRTDCSGCIMEIVRMAGVHLKAHKERLRQFHTFPSHVGRRK